MKIEDEVLLKEILANAVHGVELMLRHGASTHVFNIGQNERTGDNVVMVMQLVLEHDLPTELTRQNATYQEPLVKVQ